MDDPVWPPGGFEELALQLRSVEMPDIDGTDVPRHAYERIRKRSAFSGRSVDDEAREILIASLRADVATPEAPELTPSNS